jgi:hypothetical protein
MIQRIQSLYWLGAAICLSFLNFGVSVLNFNGKDFNYEFSLFGWKKYDAANKMVGENDMHFYLVTILIFAFIIQAIFSFKNIKRQMKLGKLVIYLHILVIIFIASVFVLGKSIFGLTYDSVQASLGVPLLSLSFVLSTTAFNSVKKDKKLLDSVDRIR